MNSVPLYAKTPIFLSPDISSLGTDSPAIKTQNLIFISGQGSLAPNAHKLSKNSASQIKQAFENLQNVVKAAGGTMDDIVKVNVYLTNIEQDYEILNKTMAGYFKKPYPARTTVEVKNLPLNQKIEIDAIMETNKK